MSIFKNGKNTSCKRGNVTVLVLHDSEGEPRADVRFDKPMDLTDVEVLRDLCNELLEAHGGHTEYFTEELDDQE